MTPGQKRVEQLTNAYARGTVACYDGHRDSIARDLDKVANLQALEVLGPDLRRLANQAKHSKWSSQLDREGATRILETLDTLGIAL